MDSGPRLISVAARQNGPGDTGKLVGECDRQHVAVEPFGCPHDPWPQTAHGGAWPSHQHDMGGLHEERSQVFVAAFGDLAEDRAIARRVLPGYEPQPGAEVASLPEAGAVADRRHHGARDDRSDPRHRHQALAAAILLRQRLDVRRHACYTLVQATPIREPFTWTADPDKIIAAVKRGHQVLDSIH